MDGVRGMGRKREKEGRKDRRKERGRGWVPVQVISLFEVLKNGRKME